MTFIFEGMEASKEFEVAQEIFTERLNRLDEAAAQSIEGTKKIKRRHMTQGKNGLEFGANDLKTQNAEMTSMEMEIKTNTEMEADMTSSQTNIENNDLQRVDIGTEDQQTNVEGTELPNMDMEKGDRQISEIDLTDHVQLMEVDSQLEQRLAERLEELERDRENIPVKEKEKQESASNVKKGKESVKLSYSEVAKGTGNVKKKSFDQD